MDDKPSASSSSSSSSWAYDVFLSFRGEDTRKKFTDHLYHALKDARINAFRDDEELQRGEHIATELEQGIRRSRMALIVFSRDYAASRWCLNELVIIMNCRRTMNQKVKPIFYDVSPSDVGEQNGSFAEAFIKHEERFGLDKVSEWRAALSEAASLPPMDLGEFSDRYEAEFVRKIVDEISRELKHNHLPVPENPVGLDSRLQDMNSLLGVGSNDVRIIGICGMGGIGKTALAKLVYNKFHHLFEGKSFLDDVREISRTSNGLVALQEQLLSDILKTGEIMLSSKDKGISIIKGRLRNRRVLVILDDVDHLDQLDALARKPDWFGVGSRIIITTRDQHLLEEIEANAVYMVQALSESDSLELFSWHAFGQAYPPDDRAQDSESVVALAGRLPLALVVLGSYLRHNAVKEWKNALDELKRICHNEIWRKLRITYDALGNGHEKDIFLDIACFFIGMDKDYIVKILDACGFFAEIGISILSKRCLVTVNEKNKVMMHDLLRDMGREIVHEESRYPGGRSRLWQSEAALSVLRNNTGTKAVEGLLLKNPGPNTVQFSTEKFANMNKLRFLYLNSVSLTGDYGKMSKDLRLLYWHKFPLKSIPTEFYTENMVVIDMQYSKLRQVWKDNKLFLEKLKDLNLSHSPCLTKTPDFLRLPNLERLILEDCTSLVELHQSIGYLDRLVVVNIKGCRSLKSIPVTICRLKSLQHLNLSDCSKINELPEDIGDIESLRELIADRTMIRQMPSSIVRLRNLRKLSLCCCNRTSSSIWSSLSPWTSAIRAEHPVFLPAALGGLSSLITLCLRECNLSNDDIPEDIGKLSSLDFLDLGGNNFSALPESVSSLQNLRFLAVDHCTKLQSLPGLPKSLVELNATNCMSLERISKVPKFEHLPTLLLANCHNLVEIPGLENSAPFGHVHMEGCNSLAGDFRESLLKGCSQSCNGSICLPGENLPSWFSHQRESPSLLFEVPLLAHCKSKNLMFGIVYASNTKNTGVQISSSVSLNNKTTGANMEFRSLPSMSPDIPHDHLCVFFLPSSISQQLNGGDHVKAVVNLGDGLIAKKCGLHLVFEEAEMNDRREGGVSNQLNDNSSDENESRTNFKRRRHNDSVDEDVGHCSARCNGSTSKKLKRET